MFFPLLFWYGGWGLVLPRIILGAVFIVHGWPKIKNLKQNATNFNGMGFKPGMLWGTIAALLEFFGGILLALAIWTPYVCFLFAGEFIVIIIWKLRKKMPFVGGYEMDLLILALVILLFEMYGGFFLIPPGGF